jgi:hypothetical protein
MINNVKRSEHQRCKMSNYLKIAFITALLCVMSITVVSTGVIAQEGPITVEESHQTRLVGYEEGQDSQSHNIENNVELQFSGEDAQNVEINIRPQKHTVINTGSINTFVEGESEVSLDVDYQSGGVELVTDEVPEDTTVMIEFETVYVGGTTNSEANSAVLDVSYQTLGGTESDKSYPLTVDLTSTADNRISELQGSKGVSLLQQLLTYIGTGGVILLIIVIGLKSMGVGGGDNNEPDL